MEAKEIRARARQSLNGSWPISIGIGVVACLLGGLITGQSFLPQVEWKIPIAFLERVDSVLLEGMSVGNWTFSIQGGLFGFVTFLVGGVIQLGYAGFLLNQHDARPTRFEDLFSQFHRFGQGFAQQFLRTLYVTLWGLLLIIPGIMAGYSYAMTPFLMAEHPELTASQAITASKEMMDGHKAELFILDVTFLGWSILASLCGNLGYLALNPYTNAAHAAFYRQLQQEQGRLCG